jgi:putative RNA 2'-phosphotransferase
MISEKENTRISKLLSLVLRHSPEAINIVLDSNGWTDVDTLLQRMNANGTVMTKEILEYVVSTNSKKRFVFNEDKTRIRANQGHSVEVDLGYEPKEPPAVLYHGTATRNLDSIMKTGLEKRQRHHVHLSTDVNIALQVGQRYGTPVIL